MKINLNNNEKIAIILIGIPASGKSTFCKRNFSNYVRINLDILKTRHQERLLIDSCFAEGKSFILDNTNPVLVDRQRYIIPAIKHGYHIVGYFMQSKIKDCVERNKNREEEAVIPSKAIAAISNKLEFPCKDEGFDELFYVKIVNDSFIIEPWRDSV